MSIRSIKGNDFRESVWDHLEPSLGQGVDPLEINDFREIIWFHVKKDLIQEDSKSWKNFSMSWHSIKFKLEIAKDLKTFAWTVLVLAIQKFRNFGDGKMH